MLELDTIPLQDIDISDVWEEDTVINFDNPPESHLSVSFFRPVIIFVLVALASNFIPTAIQKHTFYTNVTDTIMHKITGLRPCHQSVEIALQFIGVEGNASLSTGFLDIICMKHEEVVHHIEQKFPEMQLLVENNTTKEILLFTDEIINFDTIEIKMNNTINGKTAAFTVKTQNPEYTYIVGIIRVLFGIYLLPALLTGLGRMMTSESQLNSDKKMSMEQKMTFALIIFTLLYIDPIFIIHAVRPSPIHELILLLGKDAYLAYAGFYCIAVLCYFGRKPDENKALSLGFPYMFMAMAMIILMIWDTELPMTDTFKVFPSSFERFNDQTRVRYLYLCVFVIVYGVRGWMAHKKLGQSQNNRFMAYTSITIAFIFVLIVHTALVTYITKGFCNPPNDVFHMALVAAFSLMMKNGHENVGELVNQGYTRPGEDLGIADDLGLVDE